ncbi:hypothetical protein WN943_020794 [Citrus x changshan-huyou]
MIRVRIEAHPSVEPSKVVITVRAMGDGATLGSEIEDGLKRAARANVQYLIGSYTCAMPSLPTNDIRIGTLKLCGAVFIIIIIFPLLFQRIRFESGY